MAFCWLIPWRARRLGNPCRAARVRQRGSRERADRGQSETTGRGPGARPMPEVARFFGIIVRLYYDEHNPPHLHAEYGGNKVLLDFRGNILRGSFGSRTALRLLREWVDLHVGELEEDWELARLGREIKGIPPLD